MADLSQISTPKNSWHFKYNLSAVSSTDRPLTFQLRHRPHGCFLGSSLIIIAFEVKKTQPKLNERDACVEHLAETRENDLS